MGLFIYLFSWGAAEYVNVKEEPTDLKSITDKAAQTLLWTELIRGKDDSGIGWGKIYNVTLWKWIGGYGGGEETES